MKQNAQPCASVDTVERHRRVRKESVYRWIESRRMPARRVERLWKFMISEVDAWVLAGGTDGNANDAGG